MSNDSSNITNLFEGRDKGIGASSSDSDDDRAGKPRVLLADEFRSKSANQYMRREEKVFAGSSTEQEEDESQNLVPESKPGSEGEKVGDIVRFGKDSYFVIDIFEKEIMELGDKVDLNYKRFKKFEAVDGGAPRDHHFYNYRCCYSSYLCVCASSTVDRLWGILERGLASREKEGVSFFVRTYKERKELMRVAVTVTDCYQNHNLYFFDLKFPKEYPYQAPSFYYHPYDLRLSTPEDQKSLRDKHCYNIVDVFLHIQEIVLMNTNKSCNQMLDILERPLAGFQDFVIGYFRKKGPLILRNMLQEFDMEEERDKKMFWKMYFAFEGNKVYCEQILNSDLKAELEKLKKKEYTLSDYYYGSSSSNYPTYTQRDDGIKKTSKSFWNKYLSVSFD